MSSELNLVDGRGFSYDQRRGKKAQKSLKSRRAHKHGQNRRGDKERTRRVVHVVNGCHKRYAQHKAVLDAASAATALSPAPIRLKVYVRPAWLDEADPAAVVEAPAARPVYKPAHKPAEGGATKVTGKNRQKAIAQLAKRV